MELKELKCLNCGAPIKLSPNKYIYECAYCRSCFYLSVDEIDKIKAKFEEIEKDKINISL